MIFLTRFYILEEYHNHSFRFAQKIDSLFNTINITHFLECIGNLQIVAALATGYIKIFAKNCNIENYY